MVWWLYLAQIHVYGTCWVKKRDCTCSHNLLTITPTSSFQKTSHLQSKEKQQKKHLPSQPMAPSPPHPNPPLPPTSAAPHYRLPFGSLSEGVNQMEAVNTFSNCWCFAEYSETCFSKRIAFYTLYKQLESTTFSRILHTVHIHQAHHIQNPQTCWGAVMAHVVLAVLRTAPVVRVLPNGRATRMTGLFVLCSLSIVSVASSFWVGGGKWE